MGFAGWNFAGAMGANAAYSLMHRYQAFTGRKMVVLGSGNLGLQTAKLALERGVEVKAIVEVDGAVRGDAAVAAELQAAGVPIHTSHVIKEATGATDEVESVTIVAIDGDNNAVAGSEIEVEADTVCLAIGLVPTVELLNLLDCEVRFDHHRGGYAPVVDEWMRTSVENTYACGDAAGYHDGMACQPGDRQRAGPPRRHRRRRGPRRDRQRHGPRTPFAANPSRPVLQRQRGRRRMEEVAGRADERGRT